MKKKKIVPQQKKDLEVELRFIEGVSKRCPQDSTVLKALGDLYTLTGRIHEGLAVDRRLVDLCPDESDVWYNLACSLALLDQKEAAISTLAHAVELGYDHFDWMSKDADLLSLKDEPAFQQLLSLSR